MNIGKAYMLAHFSIPRGWTRKQKRNYHKTEDRRWNRTERGKRVNYGRRRKRWTWKVV